jgi:hypothetical protein
MKKIILFTAILLAMSASTTFAQATKDTVQIKTDAKKYTCTMHPEVVKNKPGKCPKCGMTLVEKKIDTAKYTCTMHPEVVKNKAGKCPKCSMKLVVKK